jgi:ornithine cyclodeaminase
MRDCARRLGIGQKLALIPELADPKNLFGSIRPLPQAAVPDLVATAASSSATEMALA